MSMFADDELGPVVIASPVDRLDAIIAARQAAERDRNARRRGTRVSHRCPACNARTFRRPRVYASRGVVDDRCDRCATGNELTGTASAWPEQHVDRSGLDAGLDTRARCPVHVTQLAPCPICAEYLEEPAP